MQTLQLPACLLLCLSPLPCLAQEVLSPLSWNSALQHPQSDIDSLAPNVLKKQSSLDLPFFDDFSSPGVYPNRERWQDRDVYINSSFPIDPPSHGVATFDALDEKGFPYNISGSKGSKPCDTLTSMPIDLGGLDGSDSVYLSFYLQQKGLGENPNIEDRFILEFKTDSGTWVTALKIKAAAPLETGDYPFIRHSIKVSNGENNFLQEDFQFRFRVQGNKTGALDHWHIDYVYIDKNRTHNDVFLSDVSIHRRPKGIFKTYYSLPYRHFVKNRKAYINGTIDFHVRNNDSILHNPNINYRITDLNSNLTIDSSAKNNQIAGLKPLSFRSASQSSKFPALPYPNASSQKIKLELALNVEAPNASSDLELTKTNDDFVMYQVFDDYFAYDDGSAEAAYGLQSVIEGAVALEFRLEVPDTLRYVAFHFTGARDPLPENKKFDIVIWEKLGKPGQEVVLATVKGAKPIYSKSLNGFVLYELDKPLVLSGNFFVGWHQYSKFRLNVGIDMSYRFFNDSKPNPNFWYNIKGKWENSTVVGTPLIRPVFGRTPSLSTQKLQTPEIAVYPNPVHDIVTIKTDEHGFTAKVFNLQGQLIEQIETDSDMVNLPVEHLQKGIYIIQVTGQTGAVFSQKLIKQ